MNSFVKLLVSPISARGSHLTADSFHPYFINPFATLHKNILRGKDYPKRLHIPSTTFFICVNIGVFNIYIIKIYPDYLCSYFTRHPLSTVLVKAHHFFSECNDCESCSFVSIGNSTAICMSVDAALCEAQPLNVNHRRQHPTHIFI